MEEGVEEGLQVVGAVEVEVEVVDHYRTYRLRCR